MKEKEILDLFKGLSRSQGRWGRLLDNLAKIKEENPEGYRNYMKNLEHKNFKDELEVIEYFEKEMGYI